jgi:hypothetical protein
MKPNKVMENDEVIVRWSPSESERATQKERMLKVIPTSLTSNQRGKD